MNLAPKASHRQSPIWPWLKQGFWQFVLLALVSFAMLGLGDMINAQGMAVTRFMARAQAPLASHLAYPGASRDQISVVMYDGQFLASQGAAWPISYQDHADWIGRLVEVPGARPKALLIDITFGQERDDPSVMALRDKLCEIRRRHGIPVFLAALPDPASGYLRVRPGLGPARGTQDGDCFTLVGVDYLPDALDGVAWTYQLHRHFDGTSWVHGLPARGSDTPSYRSAALAVAEDVAGIVPAVRPEPMALVWGYTPAPQVNGAAPRTDCRAGDPLWLHWIPRDLRLWQANDSSPLCPYHRTLSFAQIAEMDELSLAGFVGDKYVFVGAQVPGYNDFAVSPVHGLLPGVHMHAMALDNFLTYGSDYKISADWARPPIGLILLGFLSVAVVFGVNLVWSKEARSYTERMRRRWRRCKPVRMFLYWIARLHRCLGAAAPQIAPFARRAGASISIGCGWLLRVAVQSIVAILLLALLLMWVRIGTLPLVELVGMTLVAEALGYMNRIRWLVSGSDATGKN